MTSQIRTGNQRGGIIIHVAFALIALIGFTAIVIDYGVMWVSRRQAQNAADAGALAGAISYIRDNGTHGAAKSSARQVTYTNRIWGELNAATNVVVNYSGPGTSGDPDERTNIWPCNTDKGCIRVDVMRNMPDHDGTVRGTSVPSYFGVMAGVTSQGVRGTATAQVGSGNQVTCMLPFAVMDRWADNYDPTPVTTYFPNDNQTGIAGWSPNDQYTPASSPADVYIAPYDGNTNHTGWTLANDYGRQLVLKDGSTGNYSTGWSQFVCLTGPANCSGDDIRDWLTTCSPQPVGIAQGSNACTVGDEPNGCIDIKTGVAQGPVKQGVDNVVAKDPTAAWSPTANGPQGPGLGAVVGGQGMSSPRIRGMVVLDINHYVASGCTGGTCVGKVANIIGFFLEGMCNTVTLDPGIACDDPSKDIVGRIVTLPANYVGGVGEVEDSAAFVKVVRLVR